MKTVRVLVETRLKRSLVIARSVMLLFGSQKLLERFHAQHDDLDFFGDFFLTQNVAS